MAKQPQIVEEISFQNILNNKKAQLQEIQPQVYSNLVDSDPAIALLEVASYSEGLLRDRLNKSLLAVMIDYAEGEDLDNLGLLYGLKRKLIQEADSSSNPPIEAIWEDDDAFRGRILEAPKGFSVAGPRSSYVYYGKLADAQVKDISALSNSPMEVDITVLSYVGNGQAAEDLINKVYEKLNAEDIRPMGDKVEVKGATIIEYDIELELIYKNNQLVDEEGVIANIKASLQNYVNTQHTLGGYVSLAGINACAFVEEVMDVKIVSPQGNIECELFQAPYCSSISIKGGVDD